MGDGDLLHALDYSVPFDAAMPGTAVAVSPSRTLSFAEAGARSRALAVVETLARVFGYGAGARGFRLAGDVAVCHPEFRVDQGRRIFHRAIGIWRIAGHWRRTMMKSLKRCVPRPVATVLRGVWYAALIWGIFFGLTAPIQSLQYWGM